MDIANSGARLLSSDSAVFPGTEESLLQSHRFLDECNRKNRIPQKAARHIQICSDEIMTNIVSYAHAKTVRICYEINHKAVILSFEDDGIPYDPLRSEAPDVTLAARERKIGGLGLFMVRKIAGAVDYAEVNGRNRLRLEIEFDPEQGTE